MSIKINNPADNFDGIECTEFRYIKPTRQNPKPTLVYRFKKFHLDDFGNKSYSDEANKEIFVSDVNELIENDLSSGNSDSLNAFVYLQKFMANHIKNTTGIDSEYQVD